MTEQEKREIIAEIEENVMGRMKRLQTEDTQGVLKQVREKWYGASRLRHKEKTPMQDAFDTPYMAWDAWEHIRRLTCLVCGTRYVRQLSGNPDAERVCEAICQKIYDLRMELTKDAETQGKER